MDVIGIIAEYNPFHTGHAHQIIESRKLSGADATVVAVMSGCWVQQADCAIADKWRRARLALLGGVDLVLELPTPWATASAESFARGAISILSASGVVNTISFGSECGEIAVLQQVADCLDSSEYPQQLAVFLDQGLSFPTARQSAVQQMGCDHADLLSSPNNNLGIEYLRALHAISSTIRPMTIPRQGAAHNSLGVIDTPFVSATQLRHALHRGDSASTTPYLPADGLALLEKDWGLANLSRIERAMLAKLRTMTVQDWEKLPDSGHAEGLSRRMERAAHLAGSLAEFFTLAKTKRYTHARLRRLALWAFLGLTADQLPPSPPYLRVLGFNHRGQTLLKDMKKKASLPILTKPAHANILDIAGKKLFQSEAQYTDLYDLCLERIPSPGREWTSGPVIL